MVEFDASKGSIYEGQTYKLKFIFTERYPFEPPAVWFFENVPEHAHVYSNGHICMSILSAKEWSPALSVQSVCLSVISMLSSAKQKGLPPDNHSYTERTGLNVPEKDFPNWWYKDDKC